MFIKIISIEFSNKIFSSHGLCWAGKCTPWTRTSTCKFSKADLYLILPSVQNLHLQTSTKPNKHPELTNKQGTDRQIGIDDIHIMCMRISMSGCYLCINDFLQFLYINYEWLFYPWQVEQNKLNHKFSFMTKGKNMEGKVENNSFFV